MHAEANTDLYKSLIRWQPAILEDVDLTSRLDYHEIVADIAEMTLQPPHEVTHALLRLVGDGTLGYVGDDQLLSAAASCSNWFDREHDWDVDEGTVRVVPDISTALEVILMKMVPARYSLACLTPAHPVASRAAKLSNRRVFEIPMHLQDGRWAIDFDKVRDTLRRRPCILYLCNPNNPTGRAFSKDELARLSDIAKECDGYVISDEVFSPLVDTAEGHTPFASLPDADRFTFTVFSAAKGWNISGVKCAFLLHPKIRKYDRIWKRCGERASYGVTPFGASATSAALTADPAWLSSVRSMLATNVLSLCDTLDTHPDVRRVVRPQFGYLVWLDTSDWMFGRPSRSDYTWATGLRKSLKVTVAEGLKFGSHWQSHVRISVGTHPGIVREMASRILRFGCHQTCNP